MTRPEMRGPRPGEMLRQAATRGSASAREASPWAAQAQARGLRAVDREMLRLDEEKRRLVEDARAEIEQAREELDAATTLIEAVGAADGPEGVAEAIAAYLAVGLDQIRINDPEATLDPDVVDVLWNDVVVSGLVVAEQIITEAALVDGAVTARALNIVSTTGTGHSWRLDEDGLVAMHSASQEAAHFDSGGLRMWDLTGALTVRINGVQNMLAGEFRTVLPGGGQGVVINNQISNLPGVWFTPNGTVSESSPGVRMTGAEGLWVQGLNSLRFSGGRAGVAVGNTNNAGGAARGPGQLSFSVNRAAPFRIAIESLYVHFEGFYSINFLAVLNSRPGSRRAFMQIYRNAGAAARSSFGGEDIGTAAWEGWCNVGDRFDFTTWFDTDGTYNQGTSITVIFHGR